MPADDTAIGDLVNRGGAGTVGQIRVGSKTDPGGLHNY